MNTHAYSVSSEKSNEVTEQRTMHIFGFDLFYCNIFDASVSGFRLF